MTELKPCPCCGAEAELRTDGWTNPDKICDEDTPFWVSCTKCTIATGEFAYKETPIIEWNTRNED